MNPNSPATPRQTFCLFCATGKDFRSQNLTAGIASALIGAIAHLRGNKPAALEIVQKMLSGEAVAIPASVPIKTESNENKFRSLYDKAWAAGVAAANAINPIPMIVGTPSSPFGNDMDPKKPIYFVEGGACGFAWVSVRPANSSFANWIKKNNLGKTDSYAGGVSVWIGDYGQSLQRKETHAHAMAEALRAEGINAYGQSRID